MSARALKLPLSSTVIAYVLKLALIYPARIDQTPDSGAYRAAIGHFATGVTVVTSTGSAGPSGLTASAVCSLSLEPLLMVVCIDNGSRTLEAIRSRGRLAVNVLGRDQHALAISFASKQPEAVKFADVDRFDVDGVPVLAGVVSWLTGRVRDLVPGGDHVIGVAEIERVGAPGGEPLIYFRGGFRTLTDEPQPGAAAVPAPPAPDRLT